MSNPLLTLVVVDALSYSGTTWLNLVLGSHERAFTLGPPDRAWSLRDKGFARASLVHDEEDTFWRGFDKAWDRKENFLIALAGHANATHIIFDNPSARFRDEVMSDPRIAVKTLRYFRDGRAISASYWRRNRHLRYADTIAPGGWLYHSFMAFPPAAKHSQDFHYEACRDDPLGFLRRAGDFIGLAYDARALRFWEWDHHITSGNQGPIALIRLAKGRPVKGQEFYRTQFEGLQNDPMHGFRDERWREDLSRGDLYAFDTMLGAKNAAHGYERDTFTAAEIAAFRKTDSIGTMAVRMKHRLIAALHPLRGPVRKARAVGRQLQQRLSSGSAPAAAAAPAAASVITLMPELDHERLKQVKPYRVIDSGVPRSTVERNVNLNFYLAYGPDFSIASPGKVCVDPLLRYRQLLTDIGRSRPVSFVPAIDLVGMRPEGDQVLVHLRHDVDGDLVAARLEAEIERDLGIRSTFYILHTAPYYGQWDAGSNMFVRNEASAQVYREIQALGHEVALHTDPLMLYQSFGADGAAALETEIAWLRSEGVDIRGSVSHNSVSTYGAVNYAIFKDRPVSFKDRRRMKGVIKDGKWAPLQLLDEAELGLSYEGNDLFWQTETRVEYFCLMTQNEWFHQIFENGVIKLKSKAETKASWMTQDEVIERIRTVTAPCNVVLSVHPMHYGFRHQQDEPPSLAPLDVEPGDGPRPLGWPGLRPNALLARSGQAEGETEFQSIIRTNEHGLTDVPMAFIAGRETRVLFLGRNNIHAETISVASKVSQVVDRLTQKRLARSVGATSIGLPDATNLQLLAMLDACARSGAPQFDVVVLSVGADDIVLQNPEAFADLWQLDKDAAAALFPRALDERAVRALQKTPWPSASRPHWSDRLVQRAAAFFDDREPDGFAEVLHRLTQAVALLRARGGQVMLMIEDCGEKARLWTAAASPDARRRLHAVTRSRFDVLAAAAAVPLIDPYERFLGSGSFARSHWRSRPEWSLHGHAQAAEAVIEAMERRQTGRVTAESDVA